MHTPPVVTSSFARGLAVVAALAFTAAACSSTVDDAGPASTAAPTAAPTLAPVATEASTTSAAPTTTLPPTTTTDPLVTTGGVVKVANCSGVNGAAGVLTDEFAAMGFDTRKATNGVGPDNDLDISKIYAKAGSEAVAKSVSRLMGGIDIIPMPTPVWITDAQVGLADATVVVMLGHDLAGRRLAEMAG